MDIPKTFIPKDIEGKWYSFWEKNGFFKPYHADKGKFVVVIPPPNVTGIIHMGHVLNNTLQDILIRWKRMQGYETLWQPGVDHAGIATQNVVERELAKEGRTRFDLGREGLLRRVWKWKEKYGDTIVDQLKRLGISADWSRLKFTLDPDMSEAVIEAFLRLYEKGLIYRGSRIINWCPRCGTALADDEVERDEREGSLWFISYPLVKEDGEIIVATTRPETYLGDTAVAVHPDDERYKEFIGKKVRLPRVDWNRKGITQHGEATEVGNEIPIIADPRVDPKFGTGAVKITPAHDPDDFEISRAHDLPFVLVMTLEAKMNENAGPYAGLDRYEAREAILGDLREDGFLKDKRAHNLAIGTCYRCHTVIEPILSEQWFVKMKPLTEPAIKAVREGKVKIIPSFWEKVYFHWLLNVRDWCISRQIWWGHRIPVYTCKSCKHTFAAKEKPTKCPKCGSVEIVQEEDVLDTWFSSWLWPFSTFGWPKKTEALAKYYPTDVLVTGWDILFFWVARMIMAGLEFTGKIPFHTVYLNGMVRDEKRRKLSKSLGNSPDPLDLIDRYGADGVRMGMMLITPEGKDVLFSEKRLETGRNFANKIWNAARLLLLYSDGFRYKGIGEKLDIEDRWILQKMDIITQKITESLNKYDFNGAAKELYGFVWHQFCDWYLEVIKPRLDNPEEKDIPLNIAFNVLERTLRLLHPFMPFITEEIWQRLPNHEGESIIVAPWPEPLGLSDEEAVKDFEFVKGLISEVREIRSIFHIGRKKLITLYAKSPEAKKIIGILESKKDMLQFLAGIKDVRMTQEPVSGSASVLILGVPFFVPLEGINLEREKARLSEELESLKKQLEKVKKRLLSAEFIEKAPSEVVEREREKAQRFEEKRRKVETHLKFLGFEKKSL